MMLRGACPFEEVDTIVPACGPFSNSSVFVKAALFMKRSASSGARISHVFDFAKLFYFETGAQAHLA